MLKSVVEDKNIDIFPAQQFLGRLHAIGSDPHGLLVKACHHQRFIARLSQLVFVLSDIATQFARLQNDRLSFLAPVTPAQDCRLSNP